MFSNLAMFVGPPSVQEVVSPPSVQEVALSSKKRKLNVLDENQSTADEEEEDRICKDFADIFYPKVVNKEILDCLSMLPNTNRSIDGIKCNVDLMVYQNKPKTHTSFTVFLDISAKNMRWEYFQKDIVFRTKEVPHVHLYPFIDTVLYTIRYTYRRCAVL